MDNLLNEVGDQLGELRPELLEVSLDALFEYFVGSHLDKFVNSSSVFSRQAF